MPIFHLSSNTTGGWVTFTSHLKKTLTGYKKPFYATMYKVGNRTETNFRDYGYGEEYRNLAIEDAVGYTKSNPTIITAVDKRYIGAAERLVAAGAWCVVHDPTELKNLSTIVHGDRVIVVRKSMLEHLPNAHYIPHPYVRHHELASGVERHGAISISRIDFDKHTEIILDANRLLTPDQRINIRGFENRLYTKFKICPSYPEWTQSVNAYQRTHDAAYTLCKPHTYMVDMSEIKGDGGGTQYTTLEAMDAGCVCVINFNWIANRDSSECEMKDYLNCIAVASAQELADTVTGNHNCDEALILEGAEEVLSAHSPEVIAPQYLELLGK